MTMTHYMELLATAQPWHLIIFMAIPVIFAETLAVTELYILFTRNLTGAVAQLNRFAGLLVGVYFACVFVYLTSQVVLPLTTGGGWRGVGDVVAVLFYLLGVVPLGGISLMEMGIIGRGRSPEGKLKLHATFVAVFLVVAHIAMIFGMLNPEVLGWVPPTVMQM